MLEKCTECIRETNECFTCLYRTDEDPIWAIPYYEPFVNVFDVNI